MNHIVNILFSTISILQLLVSAYTLVVLLFSKSLTQDEIDRLDYRS